MEVGEESVELQEKRMWRAIPANSRRCSCRLATTETSSRRCLAAGPQNIYIVWA